MYVLNGENSKRNLSDYPFIGMAGRDQVSEVGSYVKTVSDGEEEYGNNELEGGCAAVVCIVYEVPKDWEELRVYYTPSSYWVVKSSQMFGEAAVST